jgi:hypothetical protein
MGKRKIHGTTYFQCDWTGLPMRQTNCYMPDWNESGKLLKHGSYACWEAVAAHAMEICDEEKRTKTLGYINNLVGCNVHPAPHWSKLSWFARDGVGEIVSPNAFLNVCRNTEEPVMAVRMLSDGSTHPVMCSHSDTLQKFEAHLTRPFTLHGPLHEPQKLWLVRKKSNKERDLTVFYWPVKNGLPFNATATQLFKMQIYGDVLLVQQSKEPCFLPRERYLSYMESDYHEQYATASRKRKTDSADFSTQDYSVIKAQMASDLERVEAAASACALVPERVAMAAVLPPPSGKEIATLLEARGEKPPKKMRQALEPRLLAAAVEVGA